MIVKATEAVRTASDSISTDFGLMRGRNPALKRLSLPPMRL